MIYNRNDIIDAIVSGAIKIDPFDEKHLNPNSYNLSLHHELKTYDEAYLDPRIENRTKKLIIPEEGICIYPNKLYLGRTIEYTESHGCVPGIEGRSSFGRLGLNVHVSAGFGDVGFCGTWTLELTCVEAIKLYPNMPICQIFYHEIKPSLHTYKGKYQGQEEATPCRIHEEMK